MDVWTSGRLRYSITHEISWPAGEHTRRLGLGNWICGVLAVAASAPASARACCVVLLVGELVGLIQSRISNLQFPACSLHGSVCVFFCPQWNGTESVCVVTLCTTQYVSTCMGAWWTRSTNSTTEPGGGDEGGNLPGPTRQGNKGEANWTQAQGGGC